MHSGMRLIALSTALAMSAGSGVAAKDLGCGTTDQVTHRESHFHFAKISPKWRIQVTGPNVGAAPGAPKDVCNQVLYSFQPVDPHNKSGNDFVGELAGTPKPVPGCPAPSAGVTPKENLVDGQIQVYCSTINSQTIRWASIVVWIQAHGGYYGTTYSLRMSDTSDTKPAFTGTGMDPFNHQEVAINIIPEH